MPELRERPKMERAKAQNPAVLSPKQAARGLLSKYERQFEQRVPDEENETEHATGQVESASRRVEEEMIGAVQRFHGRKRKAKVQWKSYAEHQVPGTSRPGRQTSSTFASKSADTGKRSPAAKGIWQASDSTSASTQRGATPKEKLRAIAAMLKTRENIGAAAKASGKADAVGKKLRSKATAQTLNRTRRNA
ncbi:MAG: hypothetical protein AAGU32_12725, partial [Bacillota bacterium]